MVPFLNCPESGDYHRQPQRGKLSSPAPPSASPGSGRFSVAGFDFAPPRPRPDVYFGTSDRWSEFSLTMIVICEACQTRFKIPDEKVTAKGVRVRCAKCGHTFRVVRPELAGAESEQTSKPSAAVAPLEAAADPFARFGGAGEPPGDATRPGIFSLGVEATRVPHLGPLKSGVPAAPGAFDFSSLIPPAAPRVQPARPPTSAVAIPAPRMSPPAASVPATAPAPFDFSSLGPSVAPVSAAPSSAGTPMALSPAPSAPAAHWISSLSGASPVPPVAAVAAVPSVALSSAAPASPSALDADDFFGGAFPSDDGPLDVPPDLTGAAAKNALFDMAAAIPPAPPDEPPAPQKSAAPPVAGAAYGAPVEPRPLPIKPEGPARGRRMSVLGIVVNGLIATLLALTLVVAGSALFSEGAIGADTFSLEGIKATFWSTSDVVTSDVSSGLYERESGGTLFVVRGVVENRGARPDQILVQADLIEGSRVIRSEKSVAGAAPTPEDLYRLKGAEDLAQLAQRVKSQAPKVAPSSSASFVVAFVEFPSDLAGFRVRVTATLLDPSQSAPLGP